MEVAVHHLTPPRHLGPEHPLKHAKQQQSTPIPLGQAGAKYTGTSHSASKLSDSLAMSLIANLAVHCLMIQCTRWENRQCGERDRKAGERGRETERERYPQKDRVRVGNRVAESREEEWDRAGSWGGII